MNQYLQSQESKHRMEMTLAEALEKYTLHDVVALVAKFIKVHIPCYRVPWRCLHFSVCRILDAEKEAKRISGVDYAQLCQLLPDADLVDERFREEEFLRLL